MGDRSHRVIQWVSRFLLGLAILLLLGHLAIYAHYAIGLMRFPFDYDQGEGFELEDTILFSQGEWPYRDNEVYPFYASNYPPLFHVILVPFVWVFGEEYWYGRLVGFLGTLVTAAAIGWMVYREERHRPAAILAGLSFLASNYIYHVGPLFRQHMTMVMFETLAIAVFAHVNEIEDSRRRRRMLIAGLLLLLAAGFTKQLALGTCVAVFGFQFLRNPRRSLIWGAIFGAVTGGLFLWINVSTHGEWWANIIAANVNEFFPQQFVNLFKQWFRLHRVLIGMAGLVAAYELYFTRLSLYSVWWVLAVANAILSGKWGAGDSYFATAIAATCLLAGLFAARTLRGAWVFPEIPLTRPFRRRPFRRVQAALAARSRAIIAGAGIVIPLLYMVYGLSVVKMPTEGRFFGALSDTLGLQSSYWDRYAFYDSAGWTEGYATIGHVPTQTDIHDGWRIVDILRASDRPALSEEAGFSLRAAKDVITNPTQLKNLYENDLYDPSGLIAAIRAHDFSVVVFRAQFYPPPVLDAVYEAYYPSEVIPMNGFNYEIWRPGPPQDERQALAANLEKIAPDDEITQTVNVPPDRAAAWLNHALVYHNWEPRDEAPLTPEGECFSGSYRKSDRAVRVRLCPITAGSELTLIGGAG
jgi:hypothetical protein